MLGQMMDVPLNVSMGLEFAARHHGATEIVSRTVEGPLHRYGYAEAAARTRRLARALLALGISPGDILGTLAWNTYRHLEIYYAVAGMGAVCHTVNPRLFPDQIAYIIDNAEDRYVFVDLTFVPLLEALAPRLPKVKGYILMTDRAHMPATTLPAPLCYEELIDAQPDGFEWPVLDENTAAFLCYTSGTTGHPRGVLYSHRSTMLHAYGINMADAFGLCATDAALPVVPMFHVNAWGVPFAAPIAGCKLVFPGPRLDGPNLQAMIAEEGVTITLGVPTVWLNLLNYLQESGKTLGGLQRVVVGGSACPEAVMKAFEALGARVIHAWGMTETSPLGTANAPTRETLALPPAERAALRLKQGRALFGVELKITGPDGRELPWDGVAFGNLKIRGPWIASGYYKMEDSQAHDEPGWFATGDVATIDPLGFVRIVDRTKDVIKSGGEWISSIALENIALDHPAVREAAAIARPDAKWGERPVLIVVLKDGQAAQPEDLRRFFDGKVEKWAIPDAVIVAEELPHTATGKLLKTELRRRYGGA